jgi:HD-GYP domain-containing protein (c-di-GMP phosphodiesterase class II)
MLKNKLTFKYQNIVLAISKAIELTNSRMNNHHKLVAYIAYNIAKKSGITEYQSLKDILTAGLLHDIGVLPLRGKDESEKIFNSSCYKGEDQHAAIGGAFVKEHLFLGQISTIIEKHHDSWNNNNNNLNNYSDYNYIISLADRIATMIHPNENILQERYRIIDNIRKNMDNYFCPKYVDAFLNLAGIESFWLFSTPDYIDKELEKYFFKIKANNIDYRDLNTFSFFIARLIDFRIPSTYLHSLSVAYVAEYLAKLLSFSEVECEGMFIAGLLHDIGKLAVPVKIIEKPGELLKLERESINSHSFYTYTILSIIDNIYPINEWAAYHHEKLDGSGYPFHLNAENISLGARIMCVADIFCALKEPRSYKKTLSKEKIIQILNVQSNKNKLDKKIVTLACKNYYDIEKLVTDT